MATLHMSPKTKHPSRAKIDGKWFDIRVMDYAEQLVFVEAGHGVMSGYVPFENVEEFA